MRLSHVKHNRVSVVEEEQTMLDALRDSCGLSCQETEGCIKRAAGRDPFHTGVIEATQSTSISTSLIDHVYFSQR